MKSHLMFLNIAYMTVLTIAMALLLVRDSRRERNTIEELNVQRVNLREPDGTIRLVLSNHARMPGLIVNNREFKHPNRPEAGLLFYNDEGTENGGLIFKGGVVDGLPTNAGSLSFAKWRQDQTIQFSTDQNGGRKEASVRINDRPDVPMDLPSLPEIETLPAGDARSDALRKAGISAAQRVYLGRTPDDTSKLVLRDATGVQRLVLCVEANGKASIQFLDGHGGVVETITPTPRTSRHIAFGYKEASTACASGGSH